MKIAITISCCISVIFILVVVFVIAKNNNTFNKRCVIINAIFEYNKDIINGVVTGQLISFNDLENYDRTLWRLWDWGYKSILPKDKYELIKDYIDKTHEIK